jgi:hypothetical protein
LKIWAVHALHTTHRSSFWTGAGGFSCDFLNHAMDMAFFPEFFEREPLSMAEK